MSREQCPMCHSQTALGSYVCFKCGYRNKYITARPEYFNMLPVLQRHCIASELLLDNVCYNPTLFPVNALEWLYGAGITNELIYKQCIGYNESTQQIIIPAFKDTQLIYCQARNLNRLPKYMTLFTTKNTHIEYDDHTDNDQLIIVEDHLSAIRLRKFNNVLCLSGTSLFSSQINNLLSKYNQFVFWLDADQPGIEATLKNSRKLEYFINKNIIKESFLNRSCKTYTISKITNTTKDPKKYLNNEIKNILSNQQEIICTL